MAEHLVKGLVELLNQARQTESTKMDLACNPDFNFHDAYGALSVADSQGSLCTLDILKQKFREMNPAVMPEQRHLSSFFHRFNRSRDSNLKFSEFIEAISPICETYSSMITNRKPSTRAKPKHPLLMFEADTSSNFVKTLENLFREEQALLLFINSMRQCEAYRSFEQLFDIMCAHTPHTATEAPRDVATVASFQSLLERFGHKYTVDQLDNRLLVHFFDMSADRQVSRPEVSHSLFIFNLYQLCVVP